MGEIIGETVVAENGKKGGNGDARGKGNVVVVLKVDLHCRGCVSKILKYVRGFEGNDRKENYGVVETKVEKEANKLTVEGKVDAAKLREMLQAKTKKKVEIVPVPPQQQQQKKKEKEKENDEGVINDGSGGGKSVENGKASEKKSAEKRAKELPVATVVIKLGGLDCHGCVTKINKILANTAGVQNFTIDKEKEVVTVKGTVEPKVLADNLREKMRRSVEIVPQKKEKEEKETDKEKEKDGGGGGGGGASGGGKKKGGGGAGGGKAEENNGEGTFEGSRMEYYGPPHLLPGYENRALGEYSYGLMYGEQVHAPQLFSDENPNACCVM